MKLQKLVCLIILILMTNNCSHQSYDRVDEPDVHRLPARAHYSVVPRDEYEKKLIANTVDDSVYKGLNSIFQYHASLMTREVVALQLDKQALYNGWDDNLLREKREKAFQEMSTKTQVFLAFYAPDRVNDRIIHRESPWNFYLDINGTKYQGKARKSPYNVPEFTRLYPYTNPWLTGYVIDFPVPVSATENAKVEFKITGAPGTSAQLFNSSVVSKAPQDETPNADGTTSTETKDN